MSAHKKNRDQFANEDKPIIRFNREVKLFTRDGIAITDEQAVFHWDETDSDWTMGAYDEMAGRMLK